MFVVRRTTPTGGSSQYLVEVSKGVYSWRKIAKNESRNFSTIQSASRIAKKYQGVVSEL